MRTQRDTKSGPLGCDSKTNAQMHKNNKNKTKTKQKTRTTKRNTFC